RDVQVALARRRRSDAHRLVGELDVERVGVGRRVDRHRADAHLAQGADDAQRDLAAVRNEHLVENGRRLLDQGGAMRKSGCPYSPGCAFCTRTAAIVPETSASISFISFIASTMHSTWPFSIRWPSTTYASASGLGER